MSNVINEIEIEKMPFIRPEGHHCWISSHIFDCLTFGSGRLEDNGCWEHGCPECARAHEQQFPEWWPLLAAHRRRSAGDGSLEKQRRDGSLADLHLTCSNTVVVLDMNEHEEENSSAQIAAGTDPLDGLGG